MLYLYFWLKPRWRAKMTEGNRLLWRGMSTIRTTVCQNVEALGTNMQKNKKNMTFIFLSGFVTYCCVWSDAHTQSFVMIIHKFCSVKTEARIMRVKWKRKRGKCLCVSGGCMWCEGGSVECYTRCENYFCNMSSKQQTPGDLLELTWST